MHHILSELEENVTKSKDRLPELNQDSLWVCISAVPEGQLRASRKKREGGFGCERMCAYVWDRRVDAADK